MAYGGTVRDPFRLLAPDGRTYFDILTPPHGIIRLYEMVLDSEDFCYVQAAAAIDPAVKAYWRGSGLRLHKALGKFQVRLADLAIKTAAVADSSIVRHIHRTQVRPDTTKKRHMADNVHSRPVVTVPALGIVGVADVAELDRTARGGGVYWEAQEFGTDAHVGRIVPGYFMPGRRRASTAEWRVHPEFQPSGRGPDMEIQNPIEERAFLRRGIEDAGAYRKRGLDSLKRDLIAAMNGVANTQPPAPRKSGKGTSRRRRP